MRLRVITATRGSSPYLAETVRSVAALGVDVNHFVVCPSSVRETLEKAFPRCHVVGDDTGGLYPALNAGLRAAAPDEFFTWINDDDMLVAPGFNAALGRLAADPYLAAVYGRVSLIDAGGRRIGEVPVAHRAADLAALLASGVMPLAQPGTILRWRLVDAIGVFDPSYRLAGDLDFFARALGAEIPFAFHNAEVARFRLHAGQLSKDETAAALEHARALQTVPVTPAGFSRWRFRWDNLPVYWERIRRHGFVDMRTVYRHG